MARVGANQPSDLVDVDDPMRCRAVAGRCERGVHLGDEHYTTYEEGVWRWRIDSLTIAVAQTNGELGLALTEALVERDRLADALAPLLRARHDQAHVGDIFDGGPIRHCPLCEPVWKLLNEQARGVAERGVAPTSVGGTDG